MRLTRNLQILLLIAATSALSSPAQAKVSRVDTVRVKHAKELLGKYYRRSIVRTGEKLRVGKSFIQETVKEALQYLHGKSSAGLAAKITRTIQTEAGKHRFDPVFVMAVIQSESSFDTNRRGSAGEIGLMQILPETAHWVCNMYGMKWKGEKSLRDPVTNIRIGTAYLSYLREKFDKHGRLYLAAYNMGPKNVNRALARDIWPKDYPQRVMSNYVEFYTKLKTRTD